MKILEAHEATKTRLADPDVTIRLTTKQTEQLLSRWVAEPASQPGNEQPGLTTAESKQKGKATR